MKRDAGWIELASPTGVVARAHLMVESTDEDQGTWGGRLRSVRLERDGKALVSGPYVARFGDVGEERLVRISLAEGDPTVVGEDGLLPPSLLTGEGE